MQALAARRPDLTVRLLAMTPGNMTFRQQLQAVRESRVLVAFHGAALMHILFAPPAASVLELTDVQYWTRTHFSTVARNLGITYMMLVLEGANVNDQFSVPVEAVAAMIDVHAPLAAMADK